MTHDLTRETLAMLERELGDNCAAHWNPPEQKALAHAAECVRSVAALRQQVEALQADQLRLLMERVGLLEEAEIVDAMERGEIRQVRKIATGEVIVYGSDGMHTFRGPTLAAAYAQARAAQEPI